MSNKTGFFPVCPDCNAKLRSQKRLENHQESQCNVLIWPRKPRRQGGGEDMR